MVAVPWFLGWGREPIVRLSIKANWTSTSHGSAARGFTLSTVGHWSRTIGRFLRWCEHKKHELAGLTAQDIDDYFVKGWGGVACQWQHGIGLERVSALCCIPRILRGWSAGTLTRAPRSGPGAEDWRLVGIIASAAICSFAMNMLESNHIPADLRTPRWIQN
jgi:hypothetical protein